MAAKSIRTECSVGEVLSGRWHLDRVLGAGGMAKVFAATHRNTHRVAIKVLKVELAHDRDLCARFLREGYAANRVGHRATVRVLDDDFTAAGTPYLVMELLHGENLGTRLARVGPLSADEVLLVAEEALDMLVAAHHRGVVHRDLKPENMFVTREGHLKVLDFGLARIREGSRARVNSVRFGSVLGTPAYMAPEQARGDWKEVDERTDLWALGATLFTLLSGRFVHEGSTKQEQLTAAVSTPAPSVLERCPKVPGGLADIVDRALAFEPARRWQNAEEMLRAVRVAQGLSAESVRSDPRASVASMPPLPLPGAASTFDTLLSGTLILRRSRPASRWQVVATLVLSVVRRLFGTLRR